jgi:hypothetical protein
MVAILHVNCSVHRYACVPEFARIQACVYAVQPSYHERRSVGARYKINMKKSRRGGGTDFGMSDRTIFVEPFWICTQQILIYSMGPSPTTPCLSTPSPHTPPFHFYYLSTLNKDGYSRQQSACSFGVVASTRCRRPCHGDLLPSPGK